MDGMFSLVVDETVMDPFPNVTAISVRANKSYVASERAFDWQNLWRHRLYSMATSSRRVAQQISSECSCHRRSW
jgi:hypothetical protein